MQKIKLGVHIAQAALIVVSWILEILVFRSSAKIDGRPGWFFGLVGRLLNLPLNGYGTVLTETSRVVLSYDTRSHLPHNDTKIPKNSKIRKSIRTCFGRWFVLFVVVDGFRFSG